MNFFTAQDRARKYTRYLQLLFLLAIIGIIALSNYAIYIWLYSQQYHLISFSLFELQRVYDQNLSIVISSIIFAFIAIASFYRLMTLRAGGSAIAESVGGQLISRQTDNPEHQKVLNIVDEMAIASGISVPPVYLLNELGINAFAAGWKPSNAVIGITSGAIKQLNRDELQGVIAHEFSHIFNGDMRLNLSLIAHLYGIFLIGESGKLMLRAAFHGSTRRTSRRTSKNGQGIAGLVALGFALFAIGAIGTLVGNWIKSLISRQREYLADASAVQYTRNQDGIANALKKIGGSSFNAYLTHRQAETYSHGYFSQSYHSSFFNFATHPPIEKRIKRIQPRWDGHFITPKQPTQTSKQSPTDKKQRFKQAVATGLSINQAVNQIQTSGSINEEHITIAKLWLKHAPDFIRLYAKSSPDVQWLVFALFIDKKEDIQKKQLHSIEQLHNQKAKSMTLWFYQQLQDTKHHYNSLVIELCMPALKQSSKQQYASFKSTIKQLIKADDKLDLKEWSMQRVMIQQLDEFFGLRKKVLMSLYLIGSAKNSIELILSLLAYIEHGETQAAQHAFQLGIQAIGATAFKMHDKKTISLKALDQAANELELLKIPLKQKFLTAAVTCIAHDKQVKTQSYELVRSIANIIEMPLPPIEVTL